MKTRMTIFVSLLLAGFAFTSCEDSDDNYTPDEKIVNVLYEKYPNAQRVDWELQHDHYVADFYDNNIEKEAWITTKGEWVMTESDILFNNLPDAVQTAFNESEYNEWLYTTWDVREREIQDIATKVLNDNPGFKIDDIDYKESADGSEVYIFELEKGNQEIHVTVNMEGNVVK